MEIMLDKKQIWVIFLFEFKMGPKAVETTCNINKAFGPGTANEHIVQWQFKKFCKGEESLEDEECSGWPSEVKSDRLRASLKVILLQLHAAASLHSCPTLCDPIDSSPPGSPVPGILQARKLVWVTISFSNAWKWKVKVKLLSYVRPLATPWTAAYQALHPWDFPGKSTGVECHCLLHHLCYTYSNQ